MNGFIDVLNGQSKVEFEWQDEPGEYKWKIKTDKKQQHKIVIEITECTKLVFESKLKLETLRFEVKTKLFCFCILYQMEKIRDLLLEKSYKKNRENQFPYSTFKEFKRVFTNKYS